MKRSLFSRLEEAWTLADDYNDLSSNHFPEQAVASQLLSQCKSVNPHVLQAALLLVSEAISVLDSDCSLGSKKSEMQANRPGPVLLDPVTEAGLNDFTLVRSIGGRKKV